MKIKEEHYLGEYDNITSVEILLENGKGDKLKFYLSEGEPEDMIFGRNLNSVCFITKILRTAYEAGKNGESLEYTFEEIKD